MKILILGNGFDIDLGLRTSYWSFYQKCLCKKKSFVLEGSLSEFIYNQADKKRNWFDLEETMAEYVKSQKEKLNNTILEFGKCFLQKLKEDFSDHITTDCLNITLNVKKDPVKNSLAKRLIEFQNQSHYFDNIYSFNCMQYNDLDIASDTEFDCLLGVKYLHGTYNNFIFGIAKEDCKREELSFLVKENQDGYPFEVVKEMKRDLIEAEEVFFFGHSLNRIDMSYFKSFFLNCIDSKTKRKSITFITRNEGSMDVIKRHVTDYAVPYKLLESSCDVSIIKTEDYDNNKNIASIDNLLKRLESSF